MLTAEQIHKSYGSLNVLNNISLAVDGGEVVSIVGSSGAGKTTLLQILGTLEKPDGGAVTIDGINPHKLNSRELAKFRNSKIGFVFQFHQLLPEFTAIENVMMPALIGGMNRTDAKAKAQTVLNRLGLGSRFEHQPSALSGGEQQRVAVARALINDPKVIFADEPSGNLDSHNATELHQLFFELRADLGQTFVIVTHNEALAEMADRTITMRDGIIFS